MNIEGVWVVYVRQVFRQRPPGKMPSEQELEENPLFLKLSFLLGVVVCGPE